MFHDLTLFLQPFKDVALGWTAQYIKFELEMQKSAEAVLWKWPVFVDLTTDAW